MQTIHEQIHKYIKGELTEEEVDHLWMNFLHQPVWYDYFITELTAQKLLGCSDRNVNIEERLMNRLPDLSECSVLKG